MAAQEFIYWTDDGNVAALRYRQLEVTFLQQNAVGFESGSIPFEELRAPMLTNLRMDPLERADRTNRSAIRTGASNICFLLAPAAAYVGNWLQSFREFPPRQKPGSFNLDRSDGSGDRPKKAATNAAFVDAF